MEQRIPVRQLTEPEKEKMLRALIETRGNITRAAELLSTSRQRLMDRLRRGREVLIVARQSPGGSFLGPFLRMFKRWFR